MLNSMRTVNERKQFHVTHGISLDTAPNELIDSIPYAQGFILMQEHLRK